MINKYTLLVLLLFSAASAMASPPSITLASYVDVRSFASASLEYLIDGIFFGSYFALVIYSAVLYATFKEREYLLYSALIATSFSFNLFHAYLRVYPNNVIDTAIISSVLLLIHGATVGIFSKGFIKLQSDAKNIKKYVDWVIKITLPISALLVLLIPSIASIYVMTAHLAFATMFLFLKLRGQDSAIYPCVAFGSFFIVELYAVTTHGSLDLSIMSTVLYGKISFIAHAVILSFTLTTEFRDEQRSLSQMERDYGATLKRQIEEKSAQLNGAMRSLAKAVGMVRRQSNQIDRQKSLAEAAIKDKSSFLAAASHDLKQPLSSLKMFVEALSLSIQKSSNRSIVEKINQNIQTLEKTFNALLEISRLDTKGLDIHLELIHLEDLFRSLRKSYPSRVNFKFDSISFYSDYSAIERIIATFIDNALTYSESDVDVYATASSSDIRIFVRDRGIGIPESECAKIFSEFYQLNNPERDRKKGLGLGLAIAKKMADSLEHDILLDSKLGKGSIFCLVMRNQLKKRKLYSILSRK